MRPATVALVLIGVAAGACAPSGGASDAGMDAHDEIDAPSEPDAARDDAGLDVNGLRTAFCERYAAVVCGWQAECGCGAQVVTGAVDVARCELAWTEACVESYGGFLGGGSVVDAEGASACLERLRTSNPACSGLDYRVVRNLCEPFIVEPVGLGEACLGVFCAGGTGYCRDGTCAPRLGAAEPCFLDSCRTGLVCVRGRCAPLVDEGARGCLAEEDCAPGLVCIDGVCDAPGAGGDGCFEDADCAFLSTCVGGACTAREVVCAGPHEPCGGGGHCGGATTCEPRAAEGESCERTGFARECAPQLYCADRGVCAQRPSEGEMCGPGIPCVPGLACDMLASGGTCVALPTAGERCLFGDWGPSACAGDLACVDGTCGPVPTLGMTCGDDGRCAAGLACVYSDGPRCQTPRTEGEPCSTTSECSAGLVCPGPTGRCTLPNEPGEQCPSQSECTGACVRGSSTWLECAESGTRGLPCFTHDDCAPELRCTIASPVCIAGVCPPFK